MRLTGWRGWPVCVAGSLVTLALAGSAMFSALTGQHTGLVVVLALCALAFGLMTAYSLLLLQRYRVALHDDAIEVAMVFRSKRIAKSDITAWQYASNQDNWAAVVVLSLASDPRGIEVPLVNVKHPAVDAWFAGIPNLDAQHAAESLKTLLEDPHYGASPEQRLATLNRERGIARIITLAAIAVALWIAFWPAPYDLMVAVGITLPVLAFILAVVLRDRWNFAESDAGDQRPGALSLYLFPILALALRAISDYRVVDQPRLILIGCVAAAIAWAALNLLRRASRWLSFGQAGLLFIMALFGWSAATLLNVRLGVTATQVFEVGVIAAETDGKDASLTLAPFGPYAQPYTVELPDWLVEQHPVGATARIHMQTGVLGARWWLVGASNDPAS